MQPLYPPLSPGASLRPFSADHLSRVESTGRRTPQRKLPLAILGRTFHTCGIFLCSRTQVSAVGGVWFALATAALFQIVLCRGKVGRGVKWGKLVVVAASVAIGAWAGWIAVRLLGATRVIVLGGVGLLRWRRLWVLMLVGLVMVSWDAGGAVVKKRVDNMVRGGIRDAIGDAGMRQPGREVAEKVEEIAMDKKARGRRLLAVENSDEDNELGKNLSLDRGTVIARFSKDGKSERNRTSLNLRSVDQDSGAQVHDEGLGTSKKIDSDLSEDQKEQFEGVDRSEDRIPNDGDVKNPGAPPESFSLDDMSNITSAKASRNLKIMEDHHESRNDASVAGGAKKTGKLTDAERRSDLDLKHSFHMKTTDVSGYGGIQSRMSRWPQLLETVEGVSFASLSTALLNWADIASREVCREGSPAFKHALVLSVSSVFSIVMSLVALAIGEGGTKPTLSAGLTGILWLSLPVMCRVHGNGRGDTGTHLSALGYFTSLCAAIVLTVGSMFFEADHDPFSINSYLCATLFLIASASRMGRVTASVERATIFGHLPNSGGHEASGIKKHMGAVVRNMTEFIVRSRSHKPSWQVLTFLFLQGTMVSVEGVYGLLTGSTGFISLSSDNFFCCAALAIGLLAIRRTAQRRSSVALSYGYSRLESLCGFTNGVLLIFVAILIVLEALERVFDPCDIESGHIIAVCLVGVCGNLFGLFFFPPESRRENHNVQGIYLHIWANTLAFMGMALSTVISLAFPTMVSFEPFISIPIAVIIITSAVPLLSRSGRLLALQPSRRRYHRLSSVYESLKRIKGVVKVLTFKVWDLTPSKAVASLSLLTDKEANASEIVAVSHEILLALGVPPSLATIQIRHANLTPRINATVRKEPQIPTPLYGVYVAPSSGARGERVVT